MTALKNEWFLSVQMAFRSRKVFGAFERRMPGVSGEMFELIRYHSTDYRA